MRTVAILRRRPDALRAMEKKCPVASPLRTMNARPPGPPPLTPPSPLVLFAGYSKTELTGPPSYDSAAQVSKVSCLLGPGRAAVPILSRPDPYAPIEPVRGAPLLLSLALAACVPPPGPPAPGGPGGGAPVRTSAAEYRLRATPDGYAAEIPYAYANRSGGPLYLVNCSGRVTPGLQRRAGEGWGGTWDFETDTCPSPPVVIAAGTTYRDTLWAHVTAHHPHGLLAELDSSGGGGTYRLILFEVLASYDPEARPHGPVVPLEERVSNAFRLRVP